MSAPQPSCRHNITHLPRPQLTRPGRFQVATQARTACRAAAHTDTHKRRGFIHAPQPRPRAASHTACLHASDVTRLTISQNTSPTVQATKHPMGPACLTNGPRLSGGPVPMLTMERDADKASEVPAPHVARSRGIHHTRLPARCVAPSNPAPCPWAAAALPHSRHELYFLVSWA